MSKSSDNELSPYFRLSWRLTIRYLLLYLLFGSLWITFSDMLLYSVFNDHKTLTNISILKGWLFMLASSSFFFLMLRSRQKLWSEALDKLEIQRKDLFEKQKYIDNSARMMAEADKQMEQQLFYDPLTHLPNRNFLEREFLRRKAGSSGRFGIIYLDLDDFRHVNDSHGYEAGNHILKLVAEILRRNLRESDLAVRLGADEFALLIDPIEDDKALDACISRLQSELRKPWQVEDIIIYISASSGGALYPDHGTEFGQVLQNAELAMMSCKQEGKDAFCIFMPDIRERAVKHADLLSQLRQAIDHQQFIVYYQPQINLKDGSVRGLEALARWRHPEQGIVLPGEFIPLAEQTGLIMPISKLIIAEVEKQKREWLDKGICPDKISVNVSSRRFRKSDLVRSFDKLLFGNAAGKGCLEIEITETIMIDSPETAIDAIQSLKDYGVSFALDDFGSGYASMNYLRKLPFDVLKIDLEFIKHMNKSEQDRLIVKTIIDLAHGLGMVVIAEGIETEDQYRSLIDLDCDIGQGFYFARPLPVDQLEQLLSRGFWQKD